MDFDIQPGQIDNPGEISLTTALRRELGLIPGQFLQLRSSSFQVVLKVVEQRVPNQQFAMVHQDTYNSIKGKDLEYRILEVTLGCDPEFFIMWGQRRVTATSYLPFVGEVGADGELGELRPMYAKHELDVVANLSKLISQIPAKMHRSKWVTASPASGDQFSYEAHSFFMGIAAGFHVHLGLPPEILSTRKDFSRVSMNHLVQCLDWYLSVPLVPIEENHGRRLGRSQYGKPGDYRPSDVTLEYRTPGAFFLRTPKLANSLLGTALAISETVVSRLKVASRNFANLHKMTKADLNDILPVPDKDTLLGTLQHKNVLVAQRALPSIQKQLEALPNYGKHQTAINDLFRAGEYRPRVGPNLLTNWKEKP